MQFTQHEQLNATHTTQSSAPWTFCMMYVLRCKHTYLKLEHYSTFCTGRSAASVVGTVSEVRIDASQWAKWHFHSFKLETSSRFLQISKIVIMVVYDGRLAKRPCFCNTTELKTYLSHQFEFAEKLVDLNKLESLEAMLVQNYDQSSDPRTDWHGWSV